MPLKRTRVRSPFPETPRVRDSAAAAHGNSLSQAGGSLSPTFRPHSCCSLSTVTMPLGQMNELPKLGEDHQDPREKHSLLESQLFGDEVTEGAVASPASSPVSSTPSVLFPDVLEEVGGAATQSPPQSPEGTCPSPPATALKMPSPRSKAP